MMINIRTTNFLICFAFIFYLIQICKSDDYKPLQPIKNSVNEKLEDNYTNLSNIDQTAQVSILLYHDFSLNEETDMKIRIDKFREQMKKIKESDISVISLDDFLQWKNGKKNIPNPSIIITIDDGWAEIHSLAFPILKDYKFPFTLFIYKNYVDVGGRSLTKDQINELLKSGGELGSHTISHQSLRKKESMTDERYTNFLRKEILGSKKWLEETFNKNILYFSYPFGILTDQAVKMVEKSDYKLSFTVNPAKNNWDTPHTKLNRYIINGNSEDNFIKAMTFQGDNYISDDEEDQISYNSHSNEELNSLNIRLYPEHNQLISERQPTIIADFSKLDKIIDPESIQMYLAGTGIVSAKYDKDTNQLIYILKRKIRTKRQQVYIKFKFENREKIEFIRWSFKIDQKAIYHQIIQNNNDILKHK